MIGPKLCADANPTKYRSGADASKLDDSAGALPQGAGALAAGRRGRAVGSGPPGSRSRRSGARSHGGSPVRRRAAHAGADGCRLPGADDGVAGQHRQLPQDALLQPPGAGGAERRPHRTDPHPLRQPVERPWRVGVDRIRQPSPRPVVGRRSRCAGGRGSCWGRSFQTSLGWHTRTRTLAPSHVPARRSRAPTARRR
jgi:hypothetical protein